jgi:hypothetical protein
MNSDSDEVGSKSVPGDDFYELMASARKDHEGTHQLVSV